MDKPQALLVMKGYPNPPLITAAVSLAVRNWDVTLAVSCCSARTEDYLRERGVTLCQLHPQDQPPRSWWEKWQYWRRFRREVWQLLRRVTPHTLLWISGADTALAIGRNVWQQPYVLQIHELYDHLPWYHVALREYARRAASVVVPEPHRAALLRCWYRLTRTPWVLPNKPLEHPRIRRLPIRHPIAREILSRIPDGERLVMYQGIIHAERDLRPVGRVVERLGKGWQFVVVGDDVGFLRPLQQACPQMIYVPYVPPPYHLEVTSWATIGVLAYCFDNLNNVFCAPNKIWEYSGFGLPMLGNDVPGLKTLADHGAGLCVDFRDEQSLEAAMLKLVAEEAIFAEKSKVLYDSLDVGEIVEKIASGVLSLPAPSSQSISRKSSGSMMAHRAA
ncbi:MAG: hypothetical protein KatS3mg114_1011 [Planctomycetaceae bacterium]|nr:MAG: hypothetical protein KatS3mg114_1011 [Planctomycetaceae bacterium]